MEVRAGKAASQEDLGSVQQGSRGSGRQVEEDTAPQEGSESSASRDGTGADAQAESRGQTQLTALDIVKFAVQLEEDEKSRQQEFQWDA